MRRTNNDGALRFADSAGPSVDMEIYYRDGEGTVRSFAASGSPGPSREPTFCADHFIAHGVCIDCSRQLGETVWAS
jgi:hypothetical protein